MYTFLSHCSPPRTPAKFLAAIIDGNGRQVYNHTYNILAMVLTAAQLQ